jgi:hypothetical protein
MVTATTQKRKARPAKTQAKLDGNRLTSAVFGMTPRQLVDHLGVEMTDEEIAEIAEIVREAGTAEQAANSKH